jgi:HipA-like protein
MNKLINKIKSFIPAGLEQTEAKGHESPQFIIKYKDLKIGYLELKNQAWHFKYTDDFKNQEAIAPLPDFPDIHKSYESDELWPFFLIRIPSLKQPKVQKIIRKENIDQFNQVELLKRFGQKTISNPFDLTYS